MLKKNCTCSYVQSKCTPRYKNKPITILQRFMNNYSSSTLICLKIRTICRYGLTHLKCYFAPYGTFITFMKMREQNHFVYGTVPVQYVSYSTIVPFLESRRVPYRTVSYLVCIFSKKKFLFYRAKNQKIIFYVKTSLKTELWPYDEIITWTFVRYNVRMYVLIMKNW